MTRHEFEYRMQIPDQRKSTWARVGVNGIIPTKNMKGVFFEKDDGSYLIEIICINCNCLTSRSYLLKELKGLSKLSDTYNMSVRCKDKSCSYGNYFPKSSIPLKQIIRDGVITKIIT